MHIPHVSQGTHLPFNWYSLSPLISFTLFAKVDSFVKNKIVSKKFKSRKQVDKNGGGRVLAYIYIYYIHIACLPSFPLSLLPSFFLLSFIPSLSPSLFLSCLWLQGEEGVRYIIRKPFVELPAMTQCPATVCLRILYIHGLSSTHPTSLRLQGS